MQYDNSQSLNRWVTMLHDIYGHTQNYAKSEYEIYTHLTEVCGAFGKYLFKRKQPDRAQEFLPKMFSWGVALVKKVKGGDANLEQILLSKFPTVCPYCGVAPCTCWTGDKPRIDGAKVRDEYYQKAHAQDKSVNGFQLMFRSIYENSWRGIPAVTSAPKSRQGKLNTGKAKMEPAIVRLASMHTRMFEELSELAEAMRLHHLYPSNFDNELADYFAWWFAVASYLKDVIPQRKPLLAEDLLWSAYPGCCPDCTMNPCDCRPGPVRELLSKPALNDMSRIDALTQSYNKRAFDEDVAAISTVKLVLPRPIACVRIDIDHFKRINDDFSHDAGDDALKYLVTTIRHKVRPRDRVYRLGGDEFGILCPDFSPTETEGMMARIATTLRERPLIAQKHDKSSAPISISISVGISACHDGERLEDAFKRADDAAIESKRNGRGRTTVAAATRTLTAAHGRKQTARARRART